MKFETIRGCGKFGFEYLLKDGDGARVSKKFLRSLILNIIKRSKEYFDATNGCHIFYWHEKELHSVVCPSIADLTSSYVIEHPITRKPRGEEEYSGKCDYWINYREYSFVMEIKHSYFAYHRNPSKIISERFNKCLNQLDEIKTQEARNMSINKGTIKIALQAIVFYRSSQKEIITDESEEHNLEEDFERLFKDPRFKKEPNLRSLWILDKKLVRSFEVGNGYEIYPAVAFIGYVFPLIMSEA